MLVLGQPDDDDDTDDADDIKYSNRTRKNISLE